MAYSVMRHRLLTLAAFRSAIESAEPVPALPPPPRPRSSRQLQLTTRSTESTIQRLQRWRRAGNDLDILEAMVQSGDVAAPGRALNMFNRPTRDSLQSLVVKLQADQVAEIERLRCLFQKHGPGAIGISITSISVPHTRLHRRVRRQRHGHGLWLFRMGREQSALTLWPYQTQRVPLIRRFGIQTATFRLTRHRRRILWQHPCSPIP